MGHGFVFLSLGHGCALPILGQRCAIPISARHSAHFNQSSASGALWHGQRTVDKTGQDAGKEQRTGQDRTGQDETRHDWTGNMTRLDRWHSRNMVGKARHILNFNAIRLWLFLTRTWNTLDTALHELNKTGTIATRLFNHQSYAYAGFKPKWSLAVPILSRNYWPATVTSRVEDRICTDTVTGGGWGHSEWILNSLV